MGAKIMEASPAIVSSSSISEIIFSPCSHVNGSGPNLQLAAQKVTSSEGFFSIKKKILFFLAEILQKKPADVDQLSVGSAGDAPYAHCGNSLHHMAGIKAGLCSLPPDHLSPFLQELPLALWAPVCIPPAPFFWVLSVQPAAARQLPSGGRVKQHLPPHATITANYLSPTRADVPMALF